MRVTVGVTWREHRASLAIVLALVAVTVLGCGSGSGSPSPSLSQTASSSASNSAMCAAAANLRSSLTALTQVDLRSTGTTGLQAAVANVQSAAQQLKTAASATYGSDVDALTSSLTTLSQTVTALGDQPSLGAALVQIGIQLAAVSAAGAKLGSDLASACP
jgi:hypothetical protein